MNNQPTTSEKQHVEKAYISHVLRYVGVGLISGSIVHMGTLGGGYTKYIILILLGVVAFIIGTLLEKRESTNSLAAFVAISVILSIGVGMVSGGTQHYLDGPVYASFLIPIGIAIGYYAFLARDYKSAASTKRIMVMLVATLFLTGILYYAAHKIPTLAGHAHSNTQGTMQDMMGGLDGKTGDEFDKAFISEMIVHHEGAVTMAEAALQNAKHPEIKKMAQDIIVTQTKEITQMKDWFEMWYGTHAAGH